MMLLNIAKAIRSITKQVNDRPLISQNVHCRWMSSIPSWATCDPYQLGQSKEPYHMSNIVDGKIYSNTESKLTIPNPIDKTTSPIYTLPNTQLHEIEPYMTSLRMCSKSGLHNPLKNPERYLQYGEISRKVRNQHLESVLNIVLMSISDLLGNGFLLSNIWMDG
jgi:hypothetical protein